MIWERKQVGLGMFDFLLDVMIINLSQASEIPLRWITRATIRRLRAALFLRINANDRGRFQVSQKYSILVHKSLGYPLLFMGKRGRANTKDKNKVAGSGHRDALRRYGRCTASQDC